MEQIQCWDLGQGLVLPSHIMGPWPLCILTGKVQGQDGFTDTPVAHMRLLSSAVPAPDITN